MNIAKNQSLMRLFEEIKSERFLSILSKICHIWFK